ncbi:conserved membrane protein of unknown function [Microbacterium sp. Nx66]|uniref:DUF2207 domain-containing protein n=1 Tax=Microbacterium sp. Nx66 TaxID=2766784 RepID=UPI001657256D|nr:DUF2207 domain-containing protein [Microbacterium sp. Nx66]CAD5138089.1 conserved membrane protein of unknown function [Microbacterium sp. Nx66]
MAPTRILRASAVLALAVIPVLAPSVAMAVERPATTVAAAADVDDFSYASWDAVYDVGLDDDGRARMQVTETVVARFPDADQNRGIVRGLATTYKGAGIDTRVIAVTDEDGTAVPYETEEDDGTLFVLTGDDDFVHGLTTYVIEYEMRDVIVGSAPDASGSRAADEFYWDLLPLDSTQPIEAFRADIRFDAALSTHLTGATKCYIGPSGSTEPCDLEGPVADGEATTFRVEAGPLPAADGVTVAVGFDPGTVVQPSARTPDPVADVGPVVAAVGAVGLAATGWVATVAADRRRRRATGIIVAQYDVPDDQPPLLAAALIPGAKNVVPAEIVHLAVRGTLRIEEGASDEAPRLRRQPQGSAPSPLDQAALDALFPHADADGVVDLPAESEAFATRMTALTTKGQEEASRRGLTTRARSRAAVILQSVAIAVAVVGLVVAIVAVASGRLSAGPALLAISVGTLLVAASSFFTFSRHTVLTPEGAQAYEHLQGVREFIRVAEEDRLRMLQSYTGAERRTEKGADVIHVYERLLPYAMLFGMEDEWGRVLETAYSREAHGPTWIGDPTSFALRTSLVAFMSSSTAAATYSAPSTGTSSGTGGSFGGGFSGGGGGGGFSGGR